MSLFISHAKPSDEDSPTLVFTSSILAARHLINQAEETDTMLTDIHDGVLEETESVISSHLEKGLAVYLGDCIEVCLQVTVQPNEPLTPLQRIISADSISIDDCFYRHIELEEESVLLVLKGDIHADHLDNALLCIFDNNIDAFREYRISDFINATTQPGGSVSMPDGSSVMFYSVQNA